MSASSSMFSPRCLIIACAVLLAASVTEAADAVSPDEAIVAALKMDTKYNSAARPPPDNGTANTLSLYIYPYSLVSVNSASQEVTLQFMLQKQWFDSRLSWKGKFNSSFDSTYLIFLAANKIWRPDATVNGVIEIKEVALDQSPVLIMSNGMVFHSIILLVTLKCQMEMFYFPFDSQKCGLSVGSQMQSSATMLLNVKPFNKGDKIDTYLSRNNEFCVEKLFLEKHVLVADLYKVDTVLFALEFQRQPAFYVTNLLLPSVLLLAVSALAFRLPPDCGERVSFSVTIVLSMCVFLQLAGNYTPTQSESVPLITWFFSIAVVMTMLNVLCNAFVLSCHSNQHSSSRVSSRLIRALFLNRLVTGRRSQKVDASDAADQQSEVSVRDSPASSHGNEWATVVSSADKVFFIVYAAVTVLTILPIFAFLATATRTECMGGSQTSVPDMVKG